MKIKNFMLLCLDTITPYAGVALTRPKGETLYHSIEPLNASETLLENIDELLRQAEASPKDLTGVIAIQGPGSFTGLRVGMAVANAFAHHLEIPIVGLNTEELWRHLTDETDFVYLQSMNPAEAYVAGFGKWRNKLGPLIEPEQLSGTAFWLGPLSEKHQVSLPQNWEKLIITRNPQEAWTRVANQTQLEEKKEYCLLEPFYLKKPKITLPKVRH